MGKSLLKKKRQEEKNIKKVETQNKIVKTNDKAYN